MKLTKYTLIFSIVLTFNSCASGYKTINPDNLRYISSDAKDGIILNYKYPLLHGKYAKKATKKGVKLVAVKITNNTEKDLTFGSDIILVYENGTPLPVMENEKIFRSLKQSVPSYLFYLLLSPLNLYTYSSNGEVTSSIPIGLVLGPGIAGGNMITAGSANKKLKTQLNKYNIHGISIKKGETIHGLIGIQSNSSDAIKIKVIQNDYE